METIKTFHELGLSQTSIKAVERKGFEEPTPIQAQAIPIILSSDDDIVGQAQTGTGKTAAFGLPILEMLDETKFSVKALVVAPTRELALQVSEELQSLRTGRKVKITPIYGGTSIERQMKRLKEGSDIVVGTPGRLIDLIKRKKLKLDELDFLVLDEADEMLNMGFVEDIETIIASANPDKRTFLFSATMPPAILNIAKKYMRQYQSIQVKAKELTTNLTDQIYFEVGQRDKFEALTRIVDIEPNFYGIVFCRTKSDVDHVSNRLIERGYDAEGLHGDLSQFQRERIYKKFKARQLNILVATDVAARGLDVNELTHVINYSIPQDPESYVHRIGRTGRAGKEGTAITFVTPAEYRGLIHIQKIANTNIRKEKIPCVEAIMKSKRQALIEEIREIIFNEDIEEFNEIASTLSSEFEVNTLMKGVLKYFLKDSLSQDVYNDIKDVSIDKQGKTRLFVAKGRKDGYNVKKIIDLIQAEVEIQSFKIKDIRIFDDFSFVSMPFEEAEMLVFSLGKKSKNRKPIITHAKPHKDKSKFSQTKRKAKKDSFKKDNYKKDNRKKRERRKR